MTSELIAVESSVQGSFLVRAERFMTSEVVAVSVAQVVQKYKLVLDALGHLRWLQCRKCLKFPWVARA